MDNDMTTLEQSAVSAKRPNELFRVKWIYFGLGLFILIPELLTLFFIGRSSAPDLIFLLLSMFVSSAVAWLIGRDIWTLRVRQFPLWVDVSIYILVLGSFGVAIFLRETGIYVWNTVYLDAFFIWLCAQIVAISWTTEKAKRVRVYLGARRLVFINEYNF